jgi:hypothetical protein
MLEEGARNNTVVRGQKLLSVWSVRRKRFVSVRVLYQQLEDRGCTVYFLSRVEELEEQPVCG